MPLRIIFIYKIIVLFTASAITVASFASDSIMVMGLFKNKAVVVINGNRRVLSLGQESPEGVKLISADSDEAILEIKGTQQSYGLGQDLSFETEYKKPTHSSVQIFPDDNGMYFVQGSINRYPIKFLIDTGATTIAMNATHAKRLGISYRLIGESSTVMTASGTVKGYAITLDTVKVGSIMQNNIRAVVIDGNFPSEVLLGMSFLKDLEIQRSGRKLSLKKNW